MIIRKQQNKVLAEEAKKGYEERVLAHLRRVWPDEVKADGEPATRENIRSGMETAGKYGVLSEYDVARFIDLRYVWGPEYDTDSELPWVQSVLNDPDLSGRVKMDQLYERSRMELRTRIERRSSGV